MKLKYHTTASVCVSGILYLAFNSWAMAICSFVLGIFVDFDHVIDYWIKHGLRFDIKNFFFYFHEERHLKLTLLFHSWECLIILVILTIISDWNPWVTGIFIGYSHHLILDIVFNVPNLKGLSFLFRYKNGFGSEIIYPKDRRPRF
jgi:hypothetical protein